jgi:hypothetical protein
MEKSWSDGNLKGPKAPLGGINQGKGTTCLLLKSLLQRHPQGTAKELTIEWLFITYVKGTFFGMSESGEASKRR